MDKLAIFGILAFDIVFSIIMFITIINARREEKRQLQARGSYYDAANLHWFWFMVGRFELYWLLIIYTISFVALGWIIFGYSGGIIAGLIATLVILIVVFFIKACGIEVNQPEVWLRKVFGKLDKALLPGPYLYIPGVHTFEKANTKPVVVKGIDGVFSTKDEIQVRIKIEINHRLGVVLQDEMLNDDVQKMDTINKERGIKYLEAKDERNNITRQKALDIARDYIGSYEFNDLIGSKHLHTNRLAARMRILFNEEVTEKHDFDELPEVMKKLIQVAEFDRDIFYILQENKSFTEQTGCLATSINIIDIEPADATLMTAKQKSKIAREDARAAEEEKKAMKLRAEGRADATRLEGSAKADITRQIGAAEAEATSKKEKAIANEMLRRKRSGLGDIAIGAAEIGRGLADAAREKSRK